MAQIGWSETDPVDTSSAGLGDDAIRSLKTSLRQGLDEEHLWPSGGGDAGKHRLGSARVYVGTQSAVSSAGTDGKIMWTSDTSRLFHVGSGGTSYIGGALGLSVGTTTGFGFPQRHVWIEEFGADVTASVASVLITIPNSGYSGIPYIFVSAYTTTGAPATLITAPILAVQVISGSQFMVQSSQNYTGSSPAPNAPFFWRSIGTRVL